MHISRQHGSARCYCYARTQGNDCRQRSLSLTVYEKQFEDWITQIRLPDDVPAGQAKRPDVPNSPADERRRLENRLKRLLDAYTWGDLTADEYRAARDETKRLLEALPECRPTASIEKARDLISNVGQLWQYATDEDRNQLASQLVEKIVVCDGRIEEIVPRGDLAECLPPGTLSCSGGSDGIRTRDLSLDRAAC